MSNGKAVNLTKTMINNLPSGGELWDAQVPGLHVRGGARGKAFCFAYKSPTSPYKSRRAGFGIISLDAARAKAGEWRDMISAGKDPLDVQAAEKQKAPPATFKDLEIRWEMEAKKSEQLWEDIKKSNRFFEMKKADRSMPFSFMKPNSIMGYRIQWKDILGHFGEKKILVSLTSAELTAMHQKFSIKMPRTGKDTQRGGPRKANIMVNFLGTLMQAAVMWGMLEETESAKFLVMFKRVRRNPEYGKERYITEEEMPKVRTALEKLKALVTPKGHKKSKKTLREDRRRAQFIEILFATGSRRNEFMTARLSWVDWSGKIKVIRLPDTKVGPQIVPLAGKVLQLLKERTDEWIEGGQKAEEDWVVPSTRKYGHPLRNPRKGWISFLKLAGLPTNITLHAIRHTYVTQGINEGDLSLEEAAGTVGHSSIETTKGYAHKTLAKKLASMNKVNAAMDALMAGKKIGTDENEILPDYIKKERDTLRRLQEEPPSTSAH